MNEFLKMNNKKCSCGKVHSFDVDEIYTGSGVIKKIPSVMNEYGAKKAFVFGDKNTFKAAGEQVCSILEGNEIGYTSYVLDEEMPEPDEKTVGSVIMHYDYSCDIIIGVGSGVVNDTGKILAATTGKPYVIVATAPSMDGYASATSSMTRDGLKVSLPSVCAKVIIGDTDILCKAPQRMLSSGLGDMLAKYVSILEWRISKIITGEYYCEEIASLVRRALKKCTDHATGLLERKEEAVKSVFEGLVICGAAMAYAGISRPASGIEHYFSHIWDMRGAEFSLKVDLHGIQCAVGTYLAVKYYEKLKEIKPDREKAIKFVEEFNTAKWHTELKDFLGRGADAMIALEEKEQKYSREKHKARLEVILENYEEIMDAINEELPPLSEMEKLLDEIKLPKTLTEIGVDESLLSTTFRATKDIRDKYVLSRLAWDLGVEEKLLKGE